MSAVPPRTRLGKDYWDAAAETYEKDFGETLVGKLWREAVWRELDRTFRPGERILELNCGTGIDAAHLAERGIAVVGCDISARMVEIARRRIADAGYEERVALHVLPTEEIGTLTAGDRFDGVLSNFSGLNCVEDLPAVKRDLAKLVRPGSSLFVCILGRFPLWEILWFGAHGQMAKAFRALHSEASMPSGIVVRYMSREKVAQTFAPEFSLRRVTGIGIAVPPSYMDHWARRAPTLIHALARIDRIIAKWPLFRSLGGCVLLEFERTTQRE